MNQSKLIAIDTQSMPWVERFNERIGRALFRKELYTDPETGALIRLVRYPAGVINPRPPPRRAENSTPPPRLFLVRPRLCPRVGAWAEAPGQPERHPTLRMSWGQQNPETDFVVPVVRVVVVAVR